MKSQTSQVARSCRIREWASMFQECRNRPNGMSVDKWCQENNITKVNYYYRFAQVRKACLDSIPSNAVKHAIIPVPTELMHTEPESTAVDANSALIQDSFLDISANGMTIRVTEQTSSSLLKKVLEVLAHVEWCNLFQTSVYRLRIHGLSEKYYYSRRLLQHPIVTAFLQNLLG